MTFEVHKRSHLNGGTRTVAEYEDFGSASTACEVLKRQDHSGDHSYEAVEIPSDE